MVVSWIQSPELKDIEEVDERFGEVEAIESSDSLTRNIHGSGSLRKRESIVGSDGEMKEDTKNLSSLVFSAKRTAAIAKCSLESRLLT